MVWSDMSDKKRRGTNAVVFKRYYYLTHFFGEVIFILIVKKPYNTFVVLKKIDILDI